MTAIAIPVRNDSFSTDSEHEKPGLKARVFHNARSLGRDADQNRKDFACFTIFPA